MVLYPVRSSKEGRKVGEYPVGTILLEDGRVRLDIPDKKLRARLEEHFAQTYQVRVPRGGVETVLGHAWQELCPGSPMHFKEGLRRLLTLDLVAKES